MQTETRQKTGLLMKHPPVRKKNGHSRYFSSYIRKSVRESFSNSQTKSPHRSHNKTELPALTGDFLSSTLKTIKLNPTPNRSSLTTRLSLEEFSVVSPRYSTETAFQSPQDFLDSFHWPISPSEAVNFFSKELTAYEQVEIFDYSEIWYFGIGAKKIEKIVENKNENIRGDYSGEPGDHIAYRFEIKKLLGRGSFGQVHLCYDHKNKWEVAVKVIRNKRRFYKQGLVEVRILEHIKQRCKSNTMVSILDSFKFRNHLCIVFELLSLSLYDLLKSNSFRGFSLGLIRRIAIQILSTLSTLRKLRIIHCDLKPENILLKSPEKSGIKVIDFGSACFSHEKFYTYIESRFYRAPEIILGVDYSSCIDMWSFGCIIAELYMGRPLLAGESEHEELLSMMEVKGVPPIELLKRGNRVPKFFETDFEPVLIPNSHGRIRKPGDRTLPEKIGCRDELFVDLVMSKCELECLEWAPEERIRPEQALGHPWVLSGLE